MSIPWSIPGSILSGSNDVSISKQTQSSVSVCQLLLMQNLSVFFLFTPLHQKVTSEEIKVILRLFALTFSLSISNDTLSKLMVFIR